MTVPFTAYGIEPLKPSDVPSCDDMIFPAYRHLLEQQVTFRLPSEPDQWLIQPVALVARTVDRVIGLVLAELPARPGDGAPELLSLFVIPEYRRQGIATALVAAMEQELVVRGVASVDAVYTAGKLATAALERVFEKRGWQPPAVRTVTVRFTIQEALTTHWYGRMGLLPPGAEIFSWGDLTAAERLALRESNSREPWIPISLQPWKHDARGFDPVSSVGLRYRGDVVGWVINHQIDPVTVRFTCSFMRKDLSRRARIVPLYSEALRRLSETACEVCTFVTPTVYPEMVEFIRRHIMPYANFTGETRGTRKQLPALVDRVS